MGLFLLNEEESSRIQFQSSANLRQKLKERIKWLKYFEKLALGKAAGPDDILRRVLKELAGVITQLLAIILRTQENEESQTEKG